MADHLPPTDGSDSAASAPGTATNPQSNLSGELTTMRLTDTPVVPPRAQDTIRPLAISEDGSPLGDISLSAANGRYQVVKEIARGGMGAVYRGYDHELKRETAMKVLLGKHLDHPDYVRRFHEEAWITGQLQHPGVVPIHDIGRLQGGQPFFVMKLVEGKTLAHLLHRRGTIEQDRARFLKIFEQVCQTIAYAHSRGVIHRDL